MSSPRAALPSLPGAGQHSASLSSALITSDTPDRIIATSLGIISAFEEDEDEKVEEEEEQDIGFVSGSEEHEVSGSSSDTESGPKGRLAEIEGYSGVDVDGQPYLGLEEALTSIVALLRGKLRNATRARPPKLMVESLPIHESTKDPSSRERRLLSGHSNFFGQQIDTECSNILIGLLTCLRRYHRNFPWKPKDMSHAALALVGVYH
ncbi:hypothetical protein FIBSPDRAFT_949776 [Athelia psychrophila]|uniref:Uncharacterized protein n=1 Tax=Athelia psychrophila TaxID=1759441 RepID=A0A166PDI6_9AGAM|nr:hypothetical protein FIBSPDRAFT_949776 [Fibularhizoctonia sp. CBS 109695]